METTEAGTHCWVSPCWAQVDPFAAEADYWMSSVVLLYGLAGWVVFNVPAACPLVRPSYWDRIGGLEIALVASLEPSEPWFPRLSPWTQRTGSLIPILG